MSPEQTHLIRRSFAEVEQHAEIAALEFYRRLFELDPALRPMFRSDIHVQAKKLMDMLSVCIDMLERPGELAGELEEMGARHAGYGVKDAHYSTVRLALTGMLSSVLQNRLTPETAQAWHELYDSIEAAMKRGAAFAARSGAQNGERKAPR
jgi:hemoglobin-like flavoprotein